MRDAKANDYWRDVYKDPRKYCNYIKGLSFSSDEGSNFDTTLSPGITVICGLNGAGKSSLIASIKELLGLSIPSIISKNKFKEKVSATITINRNDNNITAERNAVSQGLSLDLCKYIDSDLAIEALKYWEQKNVDELFDGIEENIFEQEDLSTISYLVGKVYTECISYESDEEVDKEEDVEGEDEKEKEEIKQLYTPVFFKVKTKNAEYDSTSMGIGEHFILYIYYMLKKIEKHSILIIEEPESYISVLSQQRIVDYLAEIISDKRISVIITTHSPHIIKRVRSENIRIISNKSGMTSIFTPKSIEEAKAYLGIEYRTLESNIATLFVEDNIAKLFLKRILKEEASLLENSIDIVYTGGHTNITARLSFDDSKYMSHRFLGIYDDDVKEKVDFKSEKIKWPYLFLPVKDCVEKEIMNFLSEEQIETALCSKLGIPCQTFAAVLSKREGEDPHDWFMDICNDLEIQYEAFIKEFYVLWKETHENEIDLFISDLSKHLFGEDVGKASLQKQYAQV